MMRLENEIKQSKKNKVIKALTVTEFYKFYKFLKDVMPVMKLIGEIYEEEGIQGKMDSLGLNKDSLNQVIATPPTSIKRELSLV